MEGPKAIFPFSPVVFFLGWFLVVYPLFAQEPGQEKPGRQIGDLQSQRTLPLIGYGVVNHWFRIDPDRLGALLVRNGLNLTGIEYVPWFDETGRGGFSLQTDLEAAKRFVNRMRSYRITTLISIVNWNGEVQRKASKEWFLEQLRQIRDQIGTDLVLLLPVSEPDGSLKATEWQTLARENWPGKMVLNGPGGRGRPGISGKMDYLDWHWCRDFDDTTVLTHLDGLEVINNTDCSPVVNPGPLRAAQMTRAAWKKKAHFLIYDFDGKQIDEKVIQAMGEILRSTDPTKP